MLLIMTGIASENFSDQAIEILRLTQDGDLLERRDLALLQAGVNSGGAGLSERGHARWAQVLDGVRNGSYTSRPFCGVPGLTQDAVGYVHWKGVSVEHYSYGADKHEEMIDAARRLGAICLTLEEAGEAVTAGRVMRFFGQIMDGPDGPSPRCLALWLVRKDKPRLKILPLVGETRAAREAEVEVLVQQCTAEWGADQIGLRNFVVKTREDLDVLLQTLSSDLQWVRMQFWRECAAEVAEFPSRAVAAIDRDRLPTRKDFERALIGPALDRVTEWSQSNFNEQEQALQVFERVRAA